MKKGFTLVELLVVVLIIGILAAVAMPQYRRSVERSRMAEIWANLGTMNSALQAFLADKPTGIDGKAYWGDLSVSFPTKNGGNTSKLNQDFFESPSGVNYYIISDNNKPKLIRADRSIDGEYVFLTIYNGKRYCSASNDSLKLCQSYAGLSNNAGSSGACDSGSTCYTE